MRTRLPSLHGRLTTFASGPWNSDGGDGIVASVAQALAAGADGVRVAVHVTSDSIPVVSDSATVGSMFRRRRIVTVERSDLGPGCVDFSSLVELTDGLVPLWADIEDGAVFEPLLAAVADHGEQAESNLWLVHRDQENLIHWRPSTTAKLVVATGRSKVTEGTERLLAGLHAADLDGLAMFHQEWSGGTIALAHRFGLMAVGTGAEFERELAAVIDGGIDAVSAKDPRRMAAVAGAYYW